MNINTIIQGTPDQTTEDLWHKAFANLSDEDRGTIDPQHKDKLDILIKDVLEAVEKKKQLCLRKRWKYKKSNGDVIILRDLLEKVLNWVGKFKEVVDVAVQYDPLHASLPWAAVRFLLQLGVGDNQTFGSMLEGVEEISNLISRYTIIELFYLQQKSVVAAEVKNWLTLSLVKLYTAVLQYLCQASRYYNQSTATRFVKATIQISSVNDCLDKISKEEKNVDRYVQLVDTEYRQNLYEGMQCIQQTLDRLSNEHRRMSHEAQFIQQSLPPIHDGVQKLTAWFTEVRQNMVDKVEDISKSLELLVLERQNTKSGTKNLESILSGLREPINRSATQISELHDSLEKSERRKVFKWMSQIPYDTHHETMGKNLLFKSGLWLLQKMEFIRWRKSSSSSILWLHGIPGSGKSKLIYTVIELFKNEGRITRSTTPIAYFYCARVITEPERADPDEIMRNIVKQLSCSKSDVPIKEPVVKVYQEKREKADENGCDPQKLTVDECVQLVLALLENDPAVIIMDALDECIPARRHEILKALNKIILGSANLVKIFVSSRDDNDIVCRLADSPNVYIHATDNGEDIDRFVDTEINKSLTDQKLLGGVISDQMKNRIITVLQNGAQGMFRWATLQIENLCDFERIKHEDDIEQELGRLPMTLKGSYDVIFKRIKDSGPRSRSVADSVMRWLLCAQCPLNSSDFITAVSVDFEGRPTVLSVRQLLHMCCNLVVLDAELDRFRFAHLSVREYMECHEEYADFNNHAHAMARCLDTFVKNTVSVFDINDLFMRYSTIYWPIHCQHLERNRLSESLKAKLQKFLCSDQGEAPVTKWAFSLNTIYESMSWADSMKDMLREELSSPPTVLFLACYFGLSSILDLLSTFASVDWNQLNGNGHTALHIAVLRDNEAVVRLLLNKKVDLEMVDKNQATALFLAAINEREKIVEFLLEKGASPDSRDCHGQTVLHRLASSRQTSVNQTIIDLLLDKGAALSVTDKYGSTPLSLAITYYNREMVWFLLKKGVESNITELHLAVQNGSENVVKLLLEKGVDPNLTERDTASRTALHLAAQSGSENAVDLLLEKGVDPNLIDENDWTALHLAARKGFENIVKLLIKKGADPHLTDKENRTALHLTSIKGHDQVVQILLNKGADVNQRDLQGRIALHIASAGRRKAIVKRFVRLASFDPSIIDMQGRNCLHFAASSGSTRLVHFFLKEGLDPNLTDRDGWTPMHWAARGGSEAAICALKDAGAASSIEAINGWNPLSVAVYHHRSFSIISMIAAICGTIPSEPPTFSGSNFEVDSSDGNQISPGVYQRVYCSGCFFIIYGPRYRCLSCKDFSYCFKCKHSSDLTHLGHKFKKLDFKVSRN